MSADLKILIPAIPVTLEVTGLVFVLAVVLGFAVFLLQRVRFAPLRAAVTLYGVVARGVPPLTWILIAFFGLPSIGLAPGPLQAGVGALAFVGTAYIAEYCRGAFHAVPRGQRDAAYSIGLSPARAMILVLLPQAMRAAVPPIINYLVGLLKDSSLVSVIGVGELTFAAYTRVSQTYEGPRVFAMAALLYLLLSYPLSVAGRAAERRLSSGYLAR